MVRQVWPALIVVGGLDAGLRAGGACVEAGTGKQGTVLGVSKEGATNVKVLWEDADSSIR